MRIDVRAPAHSITLHGSKHILSSNALLNVFKTLVCSYRITTDLNSNFIFDSTDNTYFCLLASSFVDTLEEAGSKDTCGECFFYQAFFKHRTLFLSPINNEYQTIEGTSQCLYNRQILLCSPQLGPFPKHSMPGFRHPGTYQKKPGGFFWTLLHADILSDWWWQFFRSQWASGKKFHTLVKRDTFHNKKRTTPLRQHI